MKRLYIVNILGTVFFSALLGISLPVFIWGLISNGQFLWGFFLVSIMCAITIVVNTIGNWKAQQQIKVLDAENKYLAQSVEFSRRHDEALDLIDNYGGIDGDHHKQWVLDQVVRKLTGGEEEYKTWVNIRKAEDYGWEEGIAP